MAKSIYFSLLLLVLCLIYESHGNHHIVKHIRLPSRRISGNDGSYGSSSSSSSLPTTGADTNGAVADASATSESAATSLPPSPSLRKSFSLNNSLGYGRNRGLGLNSKSMSGKHYEQQPNYMDSEDLNNGQIQNSRSSNFLNNKPLSGSYGSSSSSLPSTEAETNGAVADAAATSFSPSSLRKSFSLNNSLGYGRNRGLGLNSKSLSGNYYEQQPNDIDSGDLKNGQVQNSMSSHFLNNKPLSGVYFRNNGIDRQNSMTSGVLNSKRMNDLYSINSQKDKNLEDPSIGKKQNSITSDFQGFQGNDNSNMMNILNSMKKPLNEQRIVFKSLRKCCINGKCRMLQDGEECSIEDYFKSMKTKQQPNNSMFKTSSNGDNLDDIMSKFKSFGQSSFNNLGGDMGDFQETGKPTNMRLGSMRYSTIIPSIGSSNDMGSYVMPQKIKPINYPHSDPIDLSEDEANEIRNQVLQKSNLYREKYELEPFTLDDQLNNCAQDWANQMTKLQIFDHRENNAYGENLFASENFNNLGEQAVDSWYNEIIKFNIADEESDLSYNTETHHMTQLLWKSSTKMGVGVSKTSNGMYNVVANYDPSGNVRGFFKENLPEIKQEDIEEAIESRNSQKQSEPKLISWSSSSIPPLESEWNYEPYYN